MNAMVERFLGQTFFVSYSSLSLLEGCPRKFEFNKMHLQIDRTENHAPGVGTALHRAFQHYVVHKDEDAALMQLMLAYPFELEHEDTYGERSLEAAFATFMALKDSWDWGGYEIVEINCLDGVRRPAIEVPFQIDFAGFSLDGEFNSDGTPRIPVAYRGFIDFFFYKKLADRFRAVDLKTHRRKLKDLTAVWAFDDQVLPYGLVLEHTLGREIAAFDVEYLAAYVDLQTPKVVPYEFTKSRADVEDWFTKTMMQLNMLQQFVRNQWFPRQSHACTSWNRTCQHFEVCQSRDPDIVAAYMNHVAAADQKPMEFVPWIQLTLETA